MKHAWLPFILILLIFVTIIVRSLAEYVKENKDECNYELVKRIEARIHVNRSLEYCKYNPNGIYESTMHICEMDMPIRVECGGVDLWKYE